MMSPRLLALAGLSLAVPAVAQKAPISDTEDASLGSVEVGSGRIHPVLGLDLRNGDFVRGSYDDDAAGLGRLPAHAQIGLVAELGHDAQGAATSWFEARSSNGFHAPAATERMAPRSWYESNNLVGLAARLAPQLTGAITYAIKTSPNGVSDTTHELSVALGASGQNGIASLHPGFAMTWRPKGGGGLYTQATIEPGVPLAGEASRLSLPVVVGAGWRSFYQPGSGDRLYGSAGLAFQHRFPLAGGHLVARGGVLALVRDHRLRRLGGSLADHGTTEPYATISLSYSY